MQVGFSEQGKLSTTYHPVHFPSPCQIPKKPPLPRQAAVDSTRSFLESEAMMRTNYSAPLPQPRTEREKPQNSVIPARPITPGEILPDILQSEITRSLITENKLEMAPGTSNELLPGIPKISDADNFILQGEQPSLHAMSLPDANTTAEPETTRAYEQSLQQGKQYNQYTYETTLHT